LNFNGLIFSVSNDFIGNLFNRSELCATDGNSESLDILVDLFTLFFDISHCGILNNKYNNKLNEIKIDLRL
jgi:hypothetical protein